MKQLLSLSLLVLTLHLHAQNKLCLQHINVEDGLSQSSVYNIFQDAHGFMWFATGDGLDRYDGKEFISYKSSFNDTLSNHLKGRDINSNVIEDADHKLWMSSDEGISFMDYRHNKSGVIKDQHNNIAYGSPMGIENGKLWCIESQTGVYTIDVRTQKCNLYPFADKWQNSRDIPAVLYGGVLIANGIWMVDKAGLLYFNMSTCKDERIVLSDKFNSIYCLSGGRLILPTVEGAVLYDTANKTSTFISVKGNSKNPTQWRNFAEDTVTGTIYLGAANNGSIVKINLKSNKTELISFQENSITNLYIDRSRNLWIGTEGNGLYKLDIKSPKFSRYVRAGGNGTGDENGLMVKSIFRDNSGKIWIGTFNNGIVVYDPATGDSKKPELPVSTDNHLVGVIQKDSSGNILVTLDNRIFWFDEHSGKMTGEGALPVIESVSRDCPFIYSVVEWKKNKYLAATNNGLYIFSRKADGSVSANILAPNATNSFMRTWMYCLYRCDDSTIVAGLRNGVTWIKTNRDTFVATEEHILPSVSIRHFYKSTHHPILWIATEKGLIAYNEARRQWQVFDETNGLANSSVYAILPQNDSSLWVSTNQGISSLQVDYSDAADIKVRFTNYTSKDGLQSNEFNTGAYFRCPDGTFIFGGIAGINWFRPDKITHNPYQAQPAVTGMYVDDSLFARDTAVYLRQVTLPYNRNTIGFTFRALEFTQPDRNQFAYKLEGLDKDWVYTVSDKVRYSNLRPGSYVFLLKTSNNEGLWNNEPLAIRVVILPPFWQTWWFGTMAALLAVSLAIIVVRSYIRQKIKTKTREMEQQQALYMERLRISKDVHDDLGSGLSKISLMAEIAQKRAGGSMPLGNELHHISTVSKELVDNMRDLIWVLNPENTTLEQLVSRLREYCSDYLENIPVKVSLEFPENTPDMRISREAQRSIFLTVKEAINNCIKHSGACAIRIMLAIAGNTMNITIADNGRGFDFGQLKGSGNGLRNMRQRIELIGGDFSITSSAAGTSITISVSFDKLSDQKNTTLV